MAYTAQSIQVTTTAKLLCQPTSGNVSDPVPVVIFNNDSTNSLFLGGPAVTSGPSGDANAGLPILPQTGVSFRLFVSDPVYGIAGGGTLDVRVMVGRQ